MSTFFCLCCRLKLVLFLFYLLVIYFHFTSRSLHITSISIQHVYTRITTGQIRKWIFRTRKAFLYADRGISKYIRNLITRTTKCMLVLRPPGFERRTYWQQILYTLTNMQRNEKILLSRSEQNYFFVVGNSRSKISN